MKSFKTKHEAKIHNTRKFYIPDELQEAHFFVQGLSDFTYRTMPDHLYQEVLMYWHLENVYNALPPQT